LYHVNTWFYMELFNSTIRTQFRQNVVRLGLEINLLCVPQTHSRTVH
jgi:hypothetical protein